MILRTIVDHCCTRLSVKMMLRWSTHKEPMICKDHLDGQLTNELEKHKIKRQLSTLCEGCQMMMRSSLKQVVPINPHIYSHCNPPTLHHADHHHHLRHPILIIIIDHPRGHSQMLLMKEMQPTCKT